GRRLVAAPIFERSLQREPRLDDELLHLALRRFVAERAFVRRQRANLLHAFERGAGERDGALVAQVLRDRLAQLGGGRRPFVRLARGRTVRERGELRRHALGIGKGLRRERGAKRRLHVLASVPR